MLDVCLCCWKNFLFQVASAVSVFFIIVSILSFCLKTHPTMRVQVIRNSTIDYVIIRNNSNDNIIVMADDLQDQYVGQSDDVIVPAKSKSQASR